MLFNSPEFLFVFLPVVYGLFRWAGEPRFQPDTGLSRHHAQSAFINGIEIVGLIVLLVGVLTWKNVHEMWGSFEVRPFPRFAVAASILACTFSLSNPTQYLYWAF